MSTLQYKNFKCFTSLYHLQQSPCLYKVWIFLTIFAHIFTHKHYEPQCCHTHKTFKKVFPWHNIFLAASHDNTRTLLWLSREKALSEMAQSCRCRLSEARDGLLDSEDFTGGRLFQKGPVSLPVRNEN